LDSLEIASSSIDRIVLSHWHRDHSGGILETLRRAQRENPTNDAAPVTPIVVDLHPSRPLARGIARPPSKVVIGRLPDDPTFAEIEAAGGKVDLHSEGHSVAGGTVWVSGEIPRDVHFEVGLQGGMRWFEDEGEEKSAEKGRWIPEEDILDERYAVVDVLGKGLVVFSACSHAGICNVVQSAITTFNRPIYMIIGGFHLASSADLSELITPTVDFLSRRVTPSPTYVLPMHCTGFNAKVQLEKAFGQGCVPAGVGIKIEVLGDVTFDERLGLPSVRK